MSILAMRIKGIKIQGSTKSFRLKMKRLAIIEPSAFLGNPTFSNLTPCGKHEVTLHPKIRRRQFRKKS